MVNAQDMKQKLETYLRVKLPRRKELSVVEINQLTAGVSRENYLVTVSWQETQGTASESLIIQKDQGLFRSGQEYDSSRQYEVLKRVHGTGIPVPEVYWVEMDSEVLGHPFCVMEKMEGEVLGQGYYMYHPEHQAQLVKDYVEILAKIHSLDWQALDIAALGVTEMDLQGLGMGITAWQQLVQEASQYSPQPIMAELVTWLKRNIPQVERTTLCHGDYHLRNFLARDGRIVAVLDWEAVHIGDPMQDLGWSCIFLKTAWSSFCDETEFIRAYEETAGVKVNKESLLFWQVFAAVALISVGLTGIKAGLEAEEPDMRHLGIWPGFVPRLQDAAAQLLGF